MLYSWFDMFDLDGNGVIDDVEFKNFIEKLDDDNSIDKDEI